jgi:hypothetical protein
MAVPDLDVIFICILQKKCEGCIARKQRRFQPQTAPEDSYAVGLALVTRGSEFISATGSKQRGPGSAGPSLAFDPPINP